MFQSPPTYGGDAALRPRANDHVELVGDGEMLGINGREPHLFEASYDWRCGRARGTMLEQDRKT